MIPALSGTPPAGVRVLIATRPVDFRRGADGLAATVQSVLRQDPFSGTIFVFRVKARRAGDIVHPLFRSPGQPEGLILLEALDRTWDDGRRFRERLS